MELAPSNNPAKRGRGRPPRNLDLSSGINPLNQTRDFVCQMCGKTYLSSPALYLHMKIKHQQGEGKPIGPMPSRRGRGRPRKGAEFEPGYGNNQKLDPTGEMFLRAENRVGGPTDPLVGFECSINLLFPGKFQDYTSHPMFEYISKFSFSKTPLAYGPDSDKTKEEVGNESQALI